MSVAPGSGEGSFRVLYIDLIYMSLEINLASTLPHHPSPLPPPLRPPSPSGLGLHLCFPLLPGGCRCPGRPAAAPAAVGVRGSPARRGFVTWHGGGGKGDSCGDTAGGAALGTACPCREHSAGGSARSGAGQGEGMGGTYVMSMDWFSRSAREGAGVRAALPTSAVPQEPGSPGQRLLRSMSL